MTKKPIVPWNGRIVTNYEAYAAEGCTYWEDTTHYTVTVPADRRWLLHYGSAFISQNATCDAVMYDAADEQILYLADHAAGTGTKHFPDATLGVSFPKPIIMKEGWYITVLFGAAQDTDAYAFCVVEEFTWTSP
jgi:hypothetical protein